MKNKISKLTILFTLIIPLVIVIFGGGLIAWFIGYNFEKKLMIDLETQAIICASAIDQEKFSYHLKDIQNIKNPAYVSLHRQLELINQANRNIRWCYTVYKKDNKLFFGVESLPSNSPEYVLPGNEYSDAPEKFLDIFIFGMPTSIGPYTDSYGTFITGIAPIKDTSGNIIGALAMDIEADEWQNLIFHQYLLPIIITILLAAMIILLFILQEHEKRTYQRIAISERQFQTIFEDNGAMMLIINPKDWKIIAVNSSAANFYRISTDELKNIKFSDIINDKQNLTAATYNALLKKESVNFKTETTIADGYVKKIECYLSSIIFLSKRSLFLIFQDITERENIINKLLDSEERYRRLSEQSNDGLISIDLNGFITYTNSKIETMLGYKKGDILGKPIYSLLDENNSRLIREKILKRPQGVVEKYEMILKKNNGEHMNVIVSASPLSNEDGKIIGSFAVVTDITEITNRNLELHKQKFLYQSIIDNLSGLAWLKNTDGIFLIVNGSFLNQFNIEETGVIGKKITDFCLPELINQFVDVDEEILRTSSKKEIVLKYPSSSGILEFATILSPVKNNDGDIIAISGYAQLSNSN